MMNRTQRLILATLKELAAGMTILVLAASTMSCTQPEGDTPAAPSPTPEAAAPDISSPEAPSADSVKVESVELKVEGKELICTITANRKNVQYAFYVYHNKGIVRTQWYQTSPTFQYEVADEGDYVVQGFAKGPNNRDYKYSNRVTVKF